LVRGGGNGEGMDNKKKEDGPRCAEKRGGGETKVRGRPGHKEKELGGKSLRRGMRLEFGVARTRLMDSLASQA